MIGLQELIAGRPEQTIRQLATVRNVQSFRELVDTDRAEKEFDQFFINTRAILTVGAPLTPVSRSDAGFYTRTYNFGGAVRPLDLTGPVSVDLDWRTLINIEFAGVRCFATDDPGGTDEAYVIATLYALDPLEKERAVNTIRFGPQDISSGQVFGQGHRVDDGGFFIAGDGEIRMHVAVFDKEMGDPEDIKRKIHDYVVGGIDAGLAGLSATPIGPGGAAALIGAGYATGITEAVADQLIEWATDMFGDDLVGQHDFVLSPDYLSRLKNGNVIDRWSYSIENETYNYPEAPEDNSWLITRGSGTGSYRAFFRVRTQSKTL